jgi:hypothetical protein
MEMSKLQSAPWDEQMDQLRIQDMYGQGWRYKGHVYLGDCCFGVR